MERINEVKNKALKSVKRMVIISITSMFCTCMSNIFLGQISPETLGVYSAVNVFIISLSTFVGMGGAGILSNFFPKLDSEIQKTQLLHTYIAISFGMYAVFAAVIILFPKMNGILGGGILDGTTKWVALFIVAPIYITMMIISYLLTALLEAHISNIMSKLYAILLPVVLLSAYIVDRSFLEMKLALIIFLSVIASNILAIVLGIYCVKKEKAICRTRGFYIPKGFWAFSTTAFLQASFIFLYGNADKMFLISLKDMGQLGCYQAIISILSLLEFIPQILATVMIPYFSNIIKIGNKKEVEVSYERIEKYMLFFLVSGAIGVITLSEEILHLFGDRYIEYNYLLIILVGARCIASVWFINAPMMVVLEKNWIRLINSALQVFIQFIITICTIKSLGILGVVIGRAIGVCIAQIIPQLIIEYKSGYHIKVPKAYYFGIISTVCLGMIQVIVDLNLFLSVLIGIIGWIVFLLGGKFEKMDFMRMKNMVKD